MVYAASGRLGCEDGRRRSRRAVFTGPKRDHLRGAMCIRGRRRLGRPDQVNAIHPGLLSLLWGASRRAPSQSAPRAKSEISCGVAVSKPTTSSCPRAGFGSAIEKPFETHSDHDEAGVDARGAPDGPGAPEPGEKSGAVGCSQEPVDGAAPRSRAAPPPANEPRSPLPAVSCAARSRPARSAASIVALVPLDPSVFAGGGREREHELLAARVELTGGAVERRRGRSAGRRRRFPRPRRPASRCTGRRGSARRGESLRRELDRDQHDGGAVESRPRTRRPDAWSRVAKAFSPPGSVRAPEREEGRERERVRKPPGDRALERVDQRVAQVPEAASCWAPRLSKGSARSGTTPLVAPRARSSDRARSAPSAAAGRCRRGSPASRRASPYSPPTKRSCERSGAISASATTSPACRAPIVIVPSAPPGVGPDRGVGQHRDGEAEPGPAERERNAAIAGARRREQRQRDETRGEQQRAPAPRAAAARARARAAASRGGQRERADDGAPAIGESPQTVITSSTARNSAPTSAPKTSASPRFAARRCSRRLGARVQVRLERRDQRDERDRRLEDEDRPPVEELGQNAAERRPERRRRTCRRPSRSPRRARPIR